MMNDVEFGSDSEDSDFNPENNIDSGSDSIEEKFDGKDSDFEDKKSDNKKGMVQKKKKTKSRKTRGNAYNDHGSDDERGNEKDSIPLSAEDEKKKADALWADFLGSTEMPPEPRERENVKPVASTSTLSSKRDIPKQQEKEPTSSTPITKLFEFAGETIEVPQKSIVLPEQSVKPAATSFSVKRPSSGGLSSVLNQITKKNKLSVLDKTKLDWDSFKSKEGINDELKTHNKGKDGCVKLIFFY
jgi:hypothetical protein